jgi:hypothetical protein
MLHTKGCLLINRQPFFIIQLLLIYICIVGQNLVGPDPQPLFVGPHVLQVFAHVAAHVFAHVAASVGQQE